MQVTDAVVTQTLFWWKSYDFILCMFWTAQKKLLGSNSHVYSFLIHIKCLYITFSVLMRKVQPLSLFSHFQNKVLTLITLEPASINLLLG